MIRYIIIVWMTILAAWIQPVMGQNNDGGEGRPPYPAFPYKVTVGNTVNGSVVFEAEKTSKEEVYSGGEVVVTATPESGYVVKEIKITDQAGNEISTSDAVSEDPLVKKQTFIMPNSPVTINAGFVPGNIELGSTTGSVSCLFGQKVEYNISSLVKNMDHLVNPEFTLAEVESALPFEVVVNGSTGLLSCTPSVVGNYEMDVQISAKYVEAVSVTIAISVKTEQLSKDLQVNVLNESTACGWNSQTILEAPDKYLIALVKEGVNPLDLDWMKSIEVLKSGDYYQKYMLRNTNGVIYADDIRSVHLHLDTSAPEIKMEGDHDRVYVTVSDKLSGIAKIAYRLDNGEEKEISELGGRETYGFYVDASYETYHTVWVRVEDRVGNSSSNTERFYLVRPTYHTVTLPEILVGATTDPSAGEYSVEEGYDFTFSILLEDDYSQSVPKVMIDNGKILTPNKNGKYVISSVREDVSVSISGIVKNPESVANTIVESGTKLMVQEHTLRLQVDHPVTLYIVTLAGHLWHTQSLSVGETQVEGLLSGVYIVGLSSGERWKVIVR